MANESKMFTGLLTIVDVLTEAGFDIKDIGSFFEWMSYAKPLIKTLIDEGDSDDAILLFCVDNYVKTISLCKKMDMTINKKVKEKIENIDYKAIFKSRVKAKLESELD